MKGKKMTVLTIQFDNCGVLNFAAID